MRTTPRRKCKVPVRARPGQDAKYVLRAFRRIRSRFTCPTSRLHLLLRYARLQSLTLPKASFRQVSRNSQKGRKERGLSTQTVLTLRLTAHRSLRLKARVPESLPHARLGKRLRRGNGYFILRNALGPLSGKGVFAPIQAASILMRVAPFTPFKRPASCVMRPTRFTALAGTGFDPALIGVGPKKRASARPGGQ